MLLVLNTFNSVLGPKRDKETLKLDRLRCLEDNKRLMDEKVARKKASEQDSRYLYGASLVSVFNISRTHLFSPPLCIRFPAWARTNHA